MGNLIEKIKQKGFFHIFGANVINKIVQFCSGIFLVRILTKSDYGSYVYAQNILYIIMLLSGLGTSYALTQYGSESNHIEERNSYFKYAIKIAIPFNIVLCLFIIIYSTYSMKNGNTNIYLLLLMCLMPLFMYFFDFIQVYLRTNLLNINFSKLTSLNTFFIFIFSILGAYFFNVIGVVLGTYIAYAISLLVGFIFIKDLINQKYQKLDKVRRSQFFKYSFNSLLNNGVSQTIYLIDVFLIGLLIFDPNILASYKTATLIPIAMNFIPASIMLFIYPYFAKNQNDKKWIFNNYRKIVLFLLTFNFIVVLILQLIAPFLFKIIFGEQYLNGVEFFRILLIGYFIDSTFRITAGNILAMLKKVKTLIVINCIAGICNVMLDLILIKKFSAIGAAYTNVSIILLTAVLYTFFLIKSIKSESKNTLARS